jgi:hypothetical protein
MPKTKPEFTKPSVFKIQVPIFTNYTHFPNGQPMALVYNENRTWEGEVPVVDVTAVMGPDLKAFFLCRIHRPTGKIVIGEKVADPGW